MEEGEEISLSDFEGEVVVLNAWGQWCAPCRAEVDDLQLVQETLDPLGGTVLGINVRDYNQTIAQDFKLDNAVTIPRSTTRRFVSLRPWVGCRPRSSRPPLSWTEATARPRCS